MKYLISLAFSILLAMPSFAQRSAATDNEGRRQPSTGAKQSGKVDASIQEPASTLHQKRPGTAKPSAAKRRPAAFRWVNPLPTGHDRALRHATFRSSSMGTEVGYVILLPRDYERTEDRYPVVYYLHGGRPGSEVKSHRLATLIRTTMESEDIPPSIYVFVNGGPISHYNLPDKAGAQGADVFIHELIPHIDRTYRTIADRGGRALEGFSQGGRGTMRLSLRYPEIFSSAAAGGGGYATEKRISESGGAESETLRFAEGDNAWDLAKRYAASESPEVEWLIYVGTKGFNYENNLEYMNFLDSLGIHHRKIIVPEVPHSATEIYKKRAKQIMRFHAENFTKISRP